MKKNKRKNFFQLDESRKSSLKFSFGCLCIFLPIMLLSINNKTKDRKEKETFFNNISIKEIKKEKLIEIRAFSNTKEDIVFLNKDSNRLVYRDLKNQKIDTIKRVRRALEIFLENGFIIYTSQIETLPNGSEKHHYILKRNKLLIFD